MNPMIRKGEKMAVRWLARDQQPQQLSPTSQEALRAMREVYDVCPQEEKSLVRDAFNDYCEGAARDQGPHNLGPRGSQRPDDLRAEDEAYTVRQIKRIAQDAADKVRRLTGGARLPVKVPTFEERYPQRPKADIWGR